MDASPSPSSPPSSSRIVAVLNCYGPSGRNAAQVALREDGTVAIFGAEPALATALLVRFRACTAPRLLTPPLAA